MKLHGILPALVTPFDAIGATDFAAFAAHVTNNVAAGVTVLVHCGS